MGNLTYLNLGKQYFSIMNSRGNYDKHINITADTTLINLNTNSVTFWNWSESEMRMNKSEMEMVKGRDIM